MQCPNCKTELFGVFSAQHDGVFVQFNCEKCAVIYLKTAKIVKLDEEKS